MRSILSLLILPLLTVPVTTSPSSAQDTADLVLRRGVVYPVTSPPAPAGGGTDEFLETAESVAIRDGAITAVGADEEIDHLVGVGTEIVDLAGRVVVPGFIDAHSHLESLGRALEQVELHGATSYAEVIERVRRRADELPPDTWVRGRGWDQNDWSDSSDLPHHDELSTAVPDHPVWLTRVDGHAVLLNRKAMELVGLDRDSTSAPGGRIVRDARGDPTGVLVDRASEQFERQLPPPSFEDRKRWIRSGGAHAVARGLTTVTDMGVAAESVRAYEELATAGALPLRVALFWNGGDERIEEWLADGPRERADGRLLIRGVKLYADGALGSRGAALLEPYADDPDNLGLLVTSGHDLERLSTEALEHGFQVAIHAIGDRGVVVALDAMEAALEGPRPEARFRLEHAQTVRPQDWRRMSRLGIVASMQPTHATSDMPWAPDRLGPHRIDRAYSWRQALESGARLALGSDFPVEEADPLLGIYAAVTRQDPQGDPPGGWQPEERLTREEALRGFTAEAAWSLFLEDRVGRLEPGTRADLVVLDRDVIRIPASEIPEARVDFTIVDGEIAYDRSEEAP